MPVGVLVAGFVGDRIRGAITNRAKKTVEDKVKDEVKAVLTKTEAGRGLSRRLGKALDGISAKVRRARAALSEAASESSVGDARRHSHPGHDVARLEDLADMADEWEEVETQSEASGSQAPAMPQCTSSHRVYSVEHSHYLSRHCGSWSVR
mgnify:CR=1 FL=1